MSVRIAMEASERIALYSIAVNFSLVVCNYGLAFFSGSLALRADAIHLCADIVSAASIWAGIRISRRKTRLFPYGLYKLENLMALFTVGLLALGGFEIVQSVLAATGRLRPTRLPTAMAGIVLIILITLASSRFELKKGRELGSPSDEALVPKSFAHKGPYYVFADAGAEMHPTEMRTVAEIKTSLTAEAPNPCIIYRP